MIRSLKFGFMLGIVIATSSAAHAWEVYLDTHDGVSQVYLCYIRVSGHPRSGKDECVGPIPYSSVAPLNSPGSLNDVKEKAVQFLMLQELSSISASIGNINNTYTVEAGYNPIVAELQGLREELRNETSARLSAIVGAVEETLNALPSNVVSDPEVYQSLRDKIIEDIKRDYVLTPR